MLQPAAPHEVQVDALQPHPAWTSRPSTLDGAVSITSLVTTAGTSNVRLRGNETHVKCSISPCSV